MKCHVAGSRSATTRLCSRNSAADRNAGPECRGASGRRPRNRCGLVQSHNTRGMTHGSVRRPRPARSRAPRPAPDPAIDPAARHHGSHCKWWRGCGGSARLPPPSREATPTAGIGRLLQRRPSMPGRERASARARARTLAGCARWRVGARRPRNGREWDAQLHKAGHVDDALRPSSSKCCPNQGRYQIWGGFDQT